MNVRLRWSKSQKHIEFIRENTTTKLMKNKTDYFRSMHLFMLNNYSILSSLIGGFTKKKLLTKNELEILIVKFIRIYLHESSVPKKRGKNKKQKERVRWFYDKPHRKYQNSFTWLDYELPCESKILKNLKKEPQLLNSLEGNALFLFFFSSSIKIPITRKTVSIILLLF